MRGKRVKKTTPRQILTAFTAGVFLLSAGLLVRDLVRSASERRANERLAQLAAGEAATASAAPADDGEAEPSERDYLPPGGAERGPVRLVDHSEHYDRLPGDVYS